MKRAFLFLLALLACFCCIALASAESDGYWVDLPDEITVGLNENIRAFFGYPSGGQWVQVSCGDPDAMQDMGVGNVGGGQYRSFRMTVLGQYTVRFSSKDGSFVKEVNVTVENAATAIHFERDPIIVEVGQTVPVRYTLEGGTLYNPFRDYNHSAISIDLSGETPTITGLEADYTGITLNNGLGSLTVYVVDPCEEVRLSCVYDKGSVGYAIPLSVTDREGNPVFARVEITEGQDCAQLYRFVGSIGIEGTKPGWVTVTAYGSDGSTAELRLWMCEEPTDMKVTLSSQTIRAGESLTVSVEYLPEGSWRPLGIGFIFTPEPDSEGLEGPVAVIEGDRVIGIVPGTCTLHVWGAGDSQNYTITVTDSDQALVFERPQPDFDWTRSFQLSVHDRAGNAIPAKYECSHPFVHVTEDGLLTADQPNSYGGVTVTLENGLVYKFGVWSRQCPAWLAPEAEIISIPIDLIDVEMCRILSDVTISAPSQELVLCSSDESVIQADNFRLKPKSVGTATVTVWSKYNDVNCTVIVIVTEAAGRLFVNGTPDDAAFDIAYGTTVDLPTVTDYAGNPVNVTWTVEYESITSHNTEKHVVRIVDGKRLKCVYFDGAAYLRAVSQSGASLNLTVFPYMRASDCLFRESEYTVTTGSFVQVDFSAAPSSNGAILQPQDVTFTLTGDTDCVRVENQFSYHTFTGLREGTVTLTAKLYNGKKATAVIHVVNYKECQEGHDPEWVVQEEPGATRNGLRALRCSRCRVPLGQEEIIPCTGALSFVQDEIYLTEKGMAYLAAALNGDYKQSFTYRSSDPDVAALIGGVVMGVSPGTATITVTKGDCVPAVCRVRVLPFSQLSLPAGLTEIEEGAFQGMASTFAVIPDQVTAVGAYAFADCPYLMEVVIPSGVTQIGENAFANDPLLTITVPPGSYAEQYCVQNGLKYWYEE